MTLELDIEIQGVDGEKDNRDEVLDGEQDNRSDKTLECRLDIIL
jgi:hypothetical protein